MSKHIKAPGLRVAAITAANAEAFRKAYPQKTVVVTPQRNTAGDYEFQVWINGDGGNRRPTWNELKEATAAFLRAFLRA